MIRRLLWLAAIVGLCASPAVASDTVQTRFDANVTRAKAAMLTDPATAAVIGRENERLAAALDAKARGAALATALWLQGEAHYRIGDVVEAAALIARARVEAQRSAPGTKLEGDILLTSGTIHGNRTEVAAALADLQSAFHDFKRADDRKGQAMSLACLSFLYKDAKDDDAALRYLDQALEIRSDDPTLVVSIRNNRGLILYGAKKFAAANVAFTAALRAVRPLRSPVVELLVLRNRIRNNLAAGNLVLADRDRAAARRLITATDGVDPNLIALDAESAFLHGRFAAAGALTEQAFAGADLTTTPISARDAHQTAFNVFRALHQDGKALVHLMALKRLDDDATRLATQTSSALMAARFDSANQEAEIARMRDAERLRTARDALQRAELERTLFMVVAGATMVLIVLLLINLRVVRRSRDTVREANESLATSNTALERALAAKTEFLATTSHEIRTPLNGILGMTQVMLADGTLTPPTRDRLSVVHAAGTAMRALVDDILDAAKLETGNLTTDSAPFDIAACLLAATTMWAEQARAKGLAFTADYAGLPPMVLGDASRVRQVAANLLSNALKFTESGGVSITATARNGDVVLQVTDTGIGIPADRLAEIFEAFRQADTSTTRRYGGTGLGLSISRNLARAMGGDITVVSRPDEGTMFTVTLPLPVVTAAMPSTQEAETGPTLLIIDANPISRAMFRSLTAPHVDLVRCAGSVDEAVATLATGRVDQILIDDVTMRASGDPAAFLAPILAAADDRRVVLLWPADDAGRHDQWLKLGVAVVLGKPISGAALLDALFSPTSDEAATDRLVSQAA